MTNAERNPLKWKFTANISSLKINYTMNPVTSSGGILSLKVYWMLIISTRSKEDISILQNKYLLSSNISIIARRPLFPCAPCLLMSITVKCPIILGCQYHLRCTGHTVIDVLTRHSSVCIRQEENTNIRDFKIAGEHIWGVFVMTVVTQPGSV